MTAKKCFPKNHIKGILVNICYILGGMTLPKDYKISTVTFKVNQGH